MSRSRHTGAGPRGPAPAAGPAGIDAQILAVWRALRANPDLDVRHAMQVIDRLLDKRAWPESAPPGPASASAPSAGSPLQQAVLADILLMLLPGSAGGPCS